MASSQITLKDVYDIVNRIEDKFDKRLTPIENRVDILEDFKSRALGIMSIITVVATAAFTWAWNRLTKNA